MAINAKEFLNALEEIEVAKGISKDTILAALEEAMKKGFRKQLGGDDAIVRVNIDPSEGTIEMFQIKGVVAEVEDDFLEISVEDANEARPDTHYQAGDEFLIPASIDDLRKATAMSIKSILKQKFAEAEKVILAEQFKDKIGTMITGRVEKSDEVGVSVNIGRTSVFLPKKHLIGDERFVAGDSIRLFVKEVGTSSSGAHIVVSRTDEGFLECLFQEEIREIYDGTIVIKKIAREAGDRSKVAVYSNNPDVDPAGSCIGQNGARIQKIVSQLGNGNAKEKIDIIAYSDNPGLYVMEALKPAHVVGVNYDIDAKTATVVVKDDSLSLAIGKRGVNARLAVRLTGYKIDVKTESDAINDGLSYQSFEELQAIEIAAREKAINEAKLAALNAQREAAAAAAAALAAKQNAEKIKQQEEVEKEKDDVLPGLPEGYVAPQSRVYLDEANDMDAELEAQVENEIIEEKVETPVKEAVTTSTRNVKTTTTLSDLEKTLEDASNKEKSKNTKKSNSKKKAAKEEEYDEDSKSIINTDNSTRMAIYTEEELREMELEDKKAAEEEFNDEYEDDFDEYEEYYDNN